MSPEWTVSTRAWRVRVDGMADTSLDLTLDAAELTARLVDFRSESGTEKPLADAIETALRALPHLTVDRYGNNVVARTNLGRSERVILAGHIDTVPIADNVPSRLDEDGVLWGCGTCDMKSGVAVQLRIAATVPAPNRDLTFVFYDNEEVAAELNGLKHVSETHPEWLEGDFAVLLEPSDGQVEGGCQGTLRVLLKTTGERAHSARGWMGSNAIHAAAPILARLASYEPRWPVIDGLEYREGLNAVGISGGVAGNVIPDECVVTVNFRYAPDRTRRGGHRPRPRGLRGLRRGGVRGRRPQRRGDARPVPPGGEGVHRGGRRHPACRSTAGRTSPASRRSASRRSTTAPATRTWRTSGTSAWRSRRSSRARSA